MKTYFDVVADFVGYENICNGPSNGPVSEIKFIKGFDNIPTEEQIQAKIAELKAAEPMRLLRIERNNKLAKTDWRMTEDYPFNDKEAWRTYRQALRDLPENSSPALDEFGNLINVEWPEEPTNA